MTAEGRRRAIAEFDTSVVVEHTERTYRRLLAGRG
jgi:hypothetical protein